MFKKRILITSPSFPPQVDGLSNAVYSLALNLKKRGYQITVATYGQKRSSSFEKVNDMFVERFKINSSNKFLTKYRGDQLSYINYLENENYDFIILNAWQNWATDLYLRKKKK